jgi:hypothetical protein
MVPLGRYIIVAEQHQASLLAGHGVSQREALAAAIAEHGETERNESKLQPKAVSELLSGELGAIEAIGHGCEPRPCLLGAQQPLLGCWFHGTQDPTGYLLFGRRPIQPSPLPLLTCVSSVEVGVQPCPLVKQDPQQAGTDLGGCDTARCGLDGVRKGQAQAGLADGNGCQLVLSLRFRRLQQGREEDRSNGFASCCWCLLVGPAPREVGCFIIFPFGLRQLQVTAKMSYPSARHLQTPQKGQIGCTLDV